MSDRCDGLSQCSDGSDEDECNLVAIQEPSYDKAYPPRKKKGHPIDVKVTINLDAIQKIEALEMTFTSKLTLWLEWYDERITFSNLKSEDLTNLIGYEKALGIWIPPLIFNNTNNNLIVALDQTAILSSSKRGLPKMANKHSSINEDYLYAGSDNILIFGKDYEMTFSCVYRLSRYPFDTQTCQIEVISFIITYH